MSHWRGIDLMHKLAAAASAALLCAAAFIAALASNSIATAIVDRYGAEVALYTDSFVAPRMQEMPEHLPLSDSKKSELDGLFAPTAMGRPILGFRIWAGDEIIYSNSREMIGQHFETSPARRRAYEGGVSTELNRLDGDDEVQMRALGVHLLEVYAPLREAGTGRIVGLVETYEVGTDLYYEVRAAQTLIWLIFGGGAAGIISLLFFLAGRGSSEVTRARREKLEFRARIGNANRRIADMNELHMRRVGTELFRGPVQLMAVALLKLDALHNLAAKLDASARTPGNGDVESIKQALNEALETIRSLSESLVPSKLYDLSLADTIVTAVRRHERRTGASIACKLSLLPSNVPFSVKTSVYRFIREALDTGAGAYALRAGCQNGLLQIEVRRTAIAQQPAVSRDGDWLRSFRDGIESIGGELLIETMPGAVSYTAQLNLQELEPILG